MNKNERLLLLESVFFGMLKNENEKDLQGLKTLHELDEIAKKIDIQFLTEAAYLSEGI